MLNQRIFVVVLFVLLGMSPRSPAQAEPQVLQRVGAEAVQAALLGTTSAGNLLFECPTQTRKVGWKKLIRWSTLPPSPAASYVILVDGSRIALTDSWTGEPAVTLNEQTVTARTKLFGEIRFPRRQLRRVWFHPAGDYAQPARHRRQLPHTAPDKDRLLLDSGDTLAGTCGAIGTVVRFQPDFSREPIEFPLPKVTAITFRNTTPKLGAKNLHAGWSDGSLLVAEKFVAPEQQVQIQLSCGFAGFAGRLGDLSYLRSLQTAAVYLSDLPVLEYEHIPYLEMPWSFKLDQNVLGGPLTSQGQTYAKGLGLQTASRLTYDLAPAEGDARAPTTGRWRRFKAQLGLDDAAGGGQGSVHYRVYLRQQSSWELAFSSPVMRGGDPPQEVSVKLGTASQIALVTDFADRGDERDYANWLEARLE